MTQVYDYDGDLGDKGSLDTPEQARIFSHDPNEMENNQSHASARVRKQNNALLSRILETKGRDLSADDLSSKSSEEMSIGIHSHEIRTNNRFFARSSLRATRSLDGTTGLDSEGGIMKDSSRPSYERISILRSQRRSLRNSSHQRTMQVASTRRLVDSDVYSHDNEIGSKNNSFQKSTTNLYPLDNEVSSELKSENNVETIHDIQNSAHEKDSLNVKEKQAHVSSLDSIKEKTLPVVKNGTRSQEALMLNLNNAIHEANNALAQERLVSSDKISSASDIPSPGEKRVNSMALLRILENPSGNPEAVDNYEEESIEVRSHDPSPQVNRGTKSRISASQSLDGISNEYNVNNRIMKSSSAANNHGSNLSARDLRKSLRNGSLRRTLGRLTSRRSRDNEQLTNEVKSDISNQLVHNKSDAESRNTRDVHCNTLSDKSIVRSEDEKSVSSATNAVSLNELAKPKRVFPGRRASLSGGIVRYENRPTLRRSHSTPESNERTIRSILKSDVGVSSDRNVRDLSVRFDSIEMREFDLTVGDNPSVSRGVPISLDWNYNPETVIQSIDEYEAERPPRRHRTALFLAPAIREDMLILEWGATYKELKEVSTMTDTIRRQRWESACQNALQQKREEMLETTKRRFGRVFQGGKDRELRRLLGEVDKYHNDSHGSV